MTAEEIPTSNDEIPLPPQDMWRDLDNSDGDAETAPSAPSKRSSQPPLIAVLDYVGDDKPFRVIPLKWPFRWDGHLYTEIVVNRLTVQQMGDFWDSLPPDRDYDRVEVYGLMCGLPAAVIRALRDRDGTEVTGACFDFLPRALGGATD
jgi:hypothetical protein